MIIHKVKQAIDVPSVRDIIPSLQYKIFGTTDAENEIIESHKWGEPLRTSDSVVQRCKVCGTCICVKRKINGLFVVLSVYIDARSKVKVDMLTCNQTIAREIIE